MRKEVSSMALLVPEEIDLNIKRSGRGITVGKLDGSFESYGAQGSDALRDLKQKRRKAEIPRGEVA